MAKIFPDDFLWGASTSGHQTEGGNYDQWTVWELAHAKEMAVSAEKRYKGLPKWDEIKGQATDPENYVSGKGVDHFHRYKEDFDLLKGLNLNAFRFTVEWSRVEPEEGVWNKAAFDHYHNYIQELKSRGIEPVVNLWHWTHPVWFEEKGGFSKSGNIGYFLRFANKVAEEFKDDITFIITLNEPNVYVSYGIINNISVPPEMPKLLIPYTYRNLVKAHKYTYRILKKINPDFRIGIAQQASYDPQKNPKDIIGRVIAWGMGYAWTWWFTNRIKRSMDFFGFNYYFTNNMERTKQVNPKSPLNDMGWYMEPQNIGEVATKAWIKYHKPVLITENGLADGDDEFRQWWLKETMLSLIKARRAGAEVIGYLHWSLLDNFEWHHGWWPKFGLVAVDRENGMKRTVRPSAKWWAKQLETLRSMNDD